MTQEEPPDLYTDFTAGPVQRLQGEGIIAIAFRHLSGRQFAFALTEKEASALFVRLLSALQTKDKVPQTNASILLQRDARKTAALEVDAFDLSIRNGDAVLSIETANGLQIPFEFPASDLQSLKELIAKAEAGGR